MAANDLISGRASLWAGKTFGTARRIGSEMDVALTDNAIGSKAITLCPDGKVYEEVPLDSVRINLPAGPHLSDGENLYIALDPNTNAKAFDSTGSTDGAIQFKYLFCDRVSGVKEVRMVSSDADRNTTILDGGLTDDMTVYKGRPNAIYAFKLTSAGSDATILGHFELDPRTTA